MNGGKLPRFGTFKFGEEVFAEEGDTTLPPGVFKERVAWNFFDGTNSYDLPVNPDAASMPGPKRNIITKPTCAGRQVMMEGKKEVGQISFSGVILEEEHLRAFEEWALKRKQVRITDDLGRKYWIYIKTFSPSRQKNNTYEWYHTYTVNGIVMDRG